MTTQTAPTPTGAGTASKVTHGVHDRCQYDRPNVTALCGAVLDWDDEVPPTADVCVVCRDFDHCPICDAPVRWPV